jgi:drug/metabolite transporter (DMT)-like permease
VNDLKHRDHAFLAGVACVAIAAIAFSAKAVIIKIAYTHPVDAVTLLALRMTFSAPFFLAMAFWAGRGGGSALTRDDWRTLVLLGFLGYYLASYLDFLGLQYVTASFERLILFMYPTLVLLLSAWLLNTRVRPHHVAALILSYCGIVLVFVENIGFADDPQQVAIGGTLIFLSGAAYAVYLIGAGGIIAKLGATRFTAYAMLIACAVCVAQFLLTHRADALRLPAQVYWLSLLMAVVSTVLPAWLMAEGIRRIGAYRAAMIGAIGPVATIFLAWWILAEPVTLVQLGGAALVLGGVLLISLRK